MTMSFSMNADERLGAEEPSGSALDLLAIVKANWSTYFALTGNHFSVEVGAQTCFNHDELKVIIGADQLAKLGIRDQRELHFIILHELGHLKEFRDDTQSFLSLIASIKESPEGDEIFYLYNSLMDIYVNHNAANKAAIFSDGQGGFSDLIKNIYLTKAFPEHDLSGIPLSSQYAVYILLLGMGVARAYTISEPIQAIVKAGISFCGNHYTYEQFIETFLVPAIGKHHNDYWQATIGQRDSVIKATILPIFLELLNRDRDSDGPGPHLQKRPGTSIGGDPGGDTLSQSGREPSYGSPITHSFDPEELEKLLDSLKDLSKRDNITQAEKARHDLHRQARQIAEAAHSRDASDFADRLVRVQPIVHRLVNEFLKLCSQSRQHTRSITKYSSEGLLDIPEVIRNFGRVQREPSNAHVMRTTQSEYAIENAPLNLRLCLLPDLSGSMHTGINGLKDNVIALAAAVTTLCTIHKRHNSGIISELAIYGFDDRLHEILDPIPDASLQHVASSYERLVPSGGTCEFIALEHLALVLARVAPLDARKALNRKTINIAISLTDGDTEDVARTTEAKNALLRGRVECFGVFLRSRNSTGVTFRSIWGDRGYEIESVDGLPDVIADLKTRIQQK